MLVVCRWDGLECDRDKPCVTFIHGGNGAVVCERFTGDVDEYEKQQDDCVET